MQLLQHIGYNTYTLSNSLYSTPNPETKKEIYKERNRVSLPPV